MNEIIARMLHNGATIHSTAQDQWQLRHGTATVTLARKGAYGQWYTASFTTGGEVAHIQEIINDSNSNALEKAVAEYMHAALTALDTATRKAPTPNPNPNHSPNPNPPAPRHKARKNSKS